MDYKQHIREYIDADYEFTMAVTFRFQAPEHEKTVRVFEHDLNKAVFQYAASRYGYSLAYFGVRQRDGGGHHIHLAIGGFPPKCDIRRAIKSAIRRNRGILQKCIPVDGEWRRNYDIKRISDKIVNRETGNRGQRGWIDYQTRQLEASDDILSERQKYYGAHPLDKYFTLSQPKTMLCPAVLGESRP